MDMDTSFGAKQCDLFPIGQNLAFSYWSWQTDENCGTIHRTTALPQSQ